jgi:hypothetical protein
MKLQTRAELGNYNNNTNELRSMLNSTVLNTTVYRRQNILYADHKEQSGAVILVGRIVLSWQIMDQTNMRREFMIKESCKMTTSYPSLKGLKSMCTMKISGLNPKGSLSLISICFICF